MYQVLLLPGDVPGGCHQSVADRPSAYSATASAFFLLINLVMGSDIKRDDPVLFDHKEDRYSITDVYGNGIQVG
jgi:hypothetical protein